jgi:hypothetical protein
MPKIKKAGEKALGKVTPDSSRSIVKTTEKINVRGEILRAAFEVQAALQLTGP